MSNSAGMLRGQDQESDCGDGTDEVREELERAGRLTHTLSTLAGRVMPHEPLFVWLFGRDQEVRTIVGAILSDWSEGSIHARVAAHRIRTYVTELEQSVRGLCPRIPESPARRRHLRARADLEATLAEE
jgi:hypothetical protein